MCDNPTGGLGQVPGNQSFLLDGCLSWAWCLPDARHTIPWSDQSSGPLQEMTCLSPTTLDFSAQTCYQLRPCFGCPQLCRRGSQAIKIRLCLTGSAGARLNIRVVKSFAVLFCFKWKILTGFFTFFLLKQLPGSDEMVFCYISNLTHTMDCVEKLSTAVVANSALIVSSCVALSGAIVQPLLQPFVVDPHAFRCRLLAPKQWLVKQVGVNTLVGLSAKDAPISL